MQVKTTACPLCEAGCGLLVEVAEGVPTRVRPNPDDVMSRGFVCPKGMELLNIDGDPDRLTGPVRRRADGEFEPVSWEEAYDEVARRIREVQGEHGDDSVALYMGTVSVHKYSVLLVRNALLKALRTKNSTSAGSQDTSPRFVASHLLYGSCVAVPVPDIDRTDFFLCLGANPVVSNGSMMTAPNVKGRLKAIRERGGRLVVVDPRRSETAELADEHVSIRPGTDAALLLAMASAIEARSPSPHLDALGRGGDAVRAQLKRFPPAAVAEFTGVAADDIERLAYAFADASTSVAYCRMGPTNARHGTLACYAVDLLNIVAGRMGEVGGAMFPTPAIDTGRLARMVGADGFDRFRSRVRGLPETLLDLPATTLAEEMETPGEGQIRAFVTYAGNPVLSVPNGLRLDRALAGLDFMVSIDPYINETTRHAHLILPPGPLLAEDHLDFFFANMSVRNGVRWTPAPTTSEAPSDWEIITAIARRLGVGPTAIGPIDTVLKWLRVELSPAALANLSLRTGPYGDWFLPWKKGLSRQALEAQPNGVDLGPLEPGIRRRVRHRGKKIELAPAVILGAMDRLGDALAKGPPALVLIGRRELRSNNSWMHNVPRLMAGKNRCVLFVNPADANRFGVADGELAVLGSKIHQGEVPVHVTDEVREGVVSLPHGYGHRRAAKTLRVAAKHAGVSANDWIDDREVEAIAGQSILNGVPVTLTRLSNEVGNDS